MCLDHVVINSYIDKALSIQETEFVNEHLSSCQKCRDIISSYNTVKSTIGILAQPEISAGFIDSLFLKINSELHPSFEELSAYYDQSGDKASASEIKDHLVLCPQCSEQLNNINVLASTVFQLDNYNPSSSFLDNLAEKLVDEKIAGLSSDNLDHDTEIYQAAPDFLNGLMSRIEGLAEENLTAAEIDCISSEDLSAYLDNEQTLITFPKIETHLEDCAKCKSKYLSFKNSREFVLNLQNPDVPFNFSRKVLEDINQSEKKIIKFLPFIKKAAPRASMLAGIVIAGILVTMSRSIIEEPVQPQTASNITVRSEDLLFSPGTNTYRTDSIEVLADNSQETTLEIQDIGL